LQRWSGVWFMDLKPFSAILGVDVEGLSVLLTSYLSACAPALSST